MDFLPVIVTVIIGIFVAVSSVSKKKPVGNSIQTAPSAEIQGPPVRYSGGKGMRIFWALILAGVAAIPQAIAGAVLYGAKSGAVAFIVLLAGASVIALQILVNLIIFLARRSNYKKSDLGTIFEGLFRERAEREKFGSTGRKLGALIALCYFSLIFTVIAFICVFVGGFGASPHAGIRVATVAASVLAQTCVLYPLLPSKRLPSQYPGSELMPSQYPVLYGAAHSAAEKIGLKKRFMMYLSPDANVSIALAGKRLEIRVGKDILRALNEAELRAVMLHEFAHFLHGDLKAGGHIAWLEAFAQKKTLFRIFASAQFNAVANAAARFKLICSKDGEEKADREVLKSGAAQSFIDATAKLTMLEYYIGAPNERNIFEEEAPPKNFSVMFFKEFLHSYYKNGERWRAMCKTELPARFGTHPACSERMKNLGVAEFSIDFNRADAFSGDSGEAMQAYRLADELHGYAGTDWAEVRKQAYLEPLERTRRYETGETDKNLKEVVEAYEALCRYDEALEILDKILAETPRDSFALFKKGIILCGRHCDQGLDCLQGAAEESLHYMQNAVMLMSLYVIRHGLSERREALRAWSDKKQAEAYAFSKNMAFRKLRDLKEHSLPRETIASITEMLKAESIQSCRLVRYVTPEKTVHFMLAEPKTPWGAEGYHEKMQRIFDGLAAFGGTFFLSDARSDRKLYKKAAKIKGSELFRCEESIYNARLKRDGSADRRKYRFDKGLWFFTATLVSLFGGLAMIITGFVMTATRKDFPVGPSGIPAAMIIAGIVVFVGSIVMAIAARVAEARDKEQFRNKTFRRPQFVFTGELDEGTQDRLKARFSQTWQFAEHKGKMVFLFIWQSVPENNPVTVNLSIEVWATDGKITVEGYVKVFNRNGAYYETGLYGIDRYFVKRTLRACVGIALDILAAPPNMRV
ncbi:MAG: M48 family metalloprotease [Firmicutes bacterium]|nr:M48 family metalloprotease [Bacillota bacterium]